MKGDLKKHINKIYGDFKVIDISIEKSNWYETEFKVICSVCGSILNRKGATLYKSPKHNRYCYQGLYNNIPWKYNYSKRYANILKRCKDSKYYENIECNLEYYEFMDEMLKIQKENNILNEDMFKLTIDRIDNNKDYEIGNLRLTTMLTQIYNRGIKPNCFLAKKYNEIILSNSCKMVSDYLGVVVSAVNNCISGKSKSCQGYKFEKITEEKYIDMKSVTTKAKIFHKEYE